MPANYQFWYNKAMQDRIPQGRITIGNVNNVAGQSLQQEPQVAQYQATSASPTPTQFNMMDDPISEFKPGFRRINPEPVVAPTVPEPTPAVPAPDIGSPPQNTIPVAPLPAAPVQQPVVEPIIQPQQQVPIVQAPVGNTIPYATMEANSQLQVGGGPAIPQAPITTPGMQSGAGIKMNQAVELPEIQEPINMVAPGSNQVAVQDQEVNGIKINPYFDKKIK